MRLLFFGLLLTISHAQQLPAESRTATQVQPVWPLNIESIRTTLQNDPTTRELDLAQARLTPPVDFTTSTRNPQFEVTQITGSIESEILFVTFRCRDRKACGSFIVETVLPNSIANRPIKSYRHVFHVSPNYSVHATPLLVQPRRSAQLVIEEGGLRITELVLPTKPAHLGEVVQVKDPATHRSIMAEVTGPGLLRPAIEDNVHPRGAR